MAPEETAAVAKSLQLCLTLCDALDCSPPGSSVYGILQARILEWAAIPGDPLSAEIKPASLGSPALVGGFFTTSTTWEAPENMLLYLKWITNNNKFHVTV